MNCLKLLNDGYEACREQSSYEVSKFEYLSDYIFDFTTYQSDMAELFGRKAVEVAMAITEASTHKYIEDNENCMWYLLMCNMPFFMDRIDWGTSIRGAWWDAGTFETTGLWDGEQQVVTIHFDDAGWSEFIRAIWEFVKEDT